MVKAIEDYQEQTERRWREFVEGEGTFERCGWCQFDRDMGVEDDCGKCPVVRVFDQRCEDIPQVRAFFDTPCGSVEEREAAQVVLDLAIEHREELMAAARVIVEEVQGG